MLIVQPGPPPELVEPATVRSRVSRANLQDCPIFQNDAHDVMLRDRCSMDANERDGDDGIAVHAVHQIANPQRSNGTVAIRRGDGCVGSSADRAVRRIQPFPRSALTGDLRDSEATPAVGSRAAGRCRQIAGCACVRRGSWAARCGGAHAIPLRWIEMHAGADGQIVRATAELEAVPAVDWIRVGTPGRVRVAGRSTCGSVDRWRRWTTSGQSRCGANRIRRSGDEPLSVVASRGRSTRRPQIASPRALGINAFGGRC